MILPLRTSHCVNYTLIDRRKNCPLHGCNFCPWKFDVSCSIFSQLHYIFHKYLSSEVTTIHIFFYIMWMIKIMPQRVKLIKSRFKGGKFIWKIFWMGILLTLSVWGRGGSSSVCSGGCLPWETHLCPCVAWPCGEEVNSVKHWNSDNANLIGADNSCDKGSPPRRDLDRFYHFGNCV